MVHPEHRSAAGTTSRTLRHCDQIGLLPPSGIGNNGYRYYDEHGEGTAVFVRDAVAHYANNHL